jgi:HamA
VSDAREEQPRVKPFLALRIQRTEKEADLLGLCAGYEAGAWRADAFAKALIRNLPQFALPIERWQSFNTATGVEQLARAARAIYTTDKYENRGEVGELMLFSIMREHYHSEPVVSKFYFKSSSNDTVKGFDAVHVVSGDDGPELWLGEVKFYTNLSAAMRDVLKEIREHLDIDFLRDEFMWIENKMGDGTAHAREIKRLLDDNTSLDEVFKVMHIPVLLTYKSKGVGGHSIVDQPYLRAIGKELSDHFDVFRAKGLPTNVRIHVFLVPLLGKAHLLKSFDDRLKALQSL